MKPHNSFSPKRQEAGVALLIAIFILLLVSGVALALVANSGSESSLAGNFRSSTSAYDAGTAGLEEARGRLLSGSPGDLNVIPGFIPVGAPLAVGQVRYILNSLNPADVVAPTTPGSAYFDNEYPQEFGVPVTAAVTQTIPSVWANSAVAQMPGPLYKWVRITAATEQSLNIDVNQDGVKDAVTPLYYDPAHIDVSGNPRPSLIVVPTAPAGVPATANQVLEVTALAALPNGSRKIEQYVVTPVTFNLNFPSALSLPGANVAFNPANSNVWFANGTDGSGAVTGSPSYTPVPGCNPNPNTILPSVGVTDPAGSTANVSAVTSQIPTRLDNHYVGAGGSPSVGNVSLSSAMDTPAELDQIVQTITDSADLVLNPPTGTSASSSSLPSSMILSGSPATCTSGTVVVNGDFTLGPQTGCGILVVTGNFNYTGNSGWNGIILVIGSGTTTFQGQGGGTGQFDGAVFVATTKSTTGSQLATLGNVNFDINGGGGNGIYYDSCWIRNAQKPPTYKVLSFHEIAQ